MSLEHAARERKGAGMGWGPEQALEGYKSSCQAEALVDLSTFLSRPLQRPPPSRVYVFKSIFSPPWPSRLHREALAQASAILGLIPVVQAGGWVHRWCLIEVQVS